MNCDVFILFLFLVDAETSNWMKFVRLSGSPFEQNLVLVQEGGGIFFVASRSIAPKQELRVNYSPQYADERNLPAPEALEDEGDENQWPCFECNMRLPSSEDLQSHLDEHESAAASEPAGRKRKRSGGGQRSSSALPRSQVRRKIRVLLPERSGDKAGAEGPQAKKKWTCSQCSKQFNKESSLAR